MTYRDLPEIIQNQIQQALEAYWNQRFEISVMDEYFSGSGMRYGYIAINDRVREVMVCDCTYDDGDTLIKIIRF